MCIPKRNQNKKNKREKEYNLNPYMCVIVIFFCTVQMHELYTSYN